MAARDQIFTKASFESVWLKPLNENHEDTPVMNTNDGKTKSVGVKPCHLACSSGSKAMAQSPGVFTIIIKHIVMPLKISRDSKRIFILRILDKCKRIFEKKYPFSVSNTEGGKDLDLFF